MTDYDSPWKECLEEFFEAFVEFFFPQAHADIDWPRGVEFLDTELQQILRDADQGRRIVDKLARVWRKDGHEDWVLAHVEIQGDHTDDFEERMFACHYRIFDKYQRRVATLVVLADENPRWRPSGFGYELWGCRVQFEFPTSKDRSRNNCLIVAFRSAKGRAFAERKTTINSRTVLSCWISLRIGLAWNRIPTFSQCWSWPISRRRRLVVTPMPGTLGS